MKDYTKIRTYFQENWLLVVMLVLTGLCFDGLMWILPILEGKTINSLYDQNKMEVIKLVIIFLGFVFFVQINRFFKRYLVRVFGNKIALKMREVSLNNLLERDLSYFANNPVGDILNKNLTDIYDTTEGIRKMTTEIFDTFVLLLGYLISLMLIDYQITLIIIIPATIAVLIAELLKGKIYLANKEYKEYLSKNKEINLRLLNNELYYRGLGVSERYDKDYQESVKILSKKNRKALILQSSLEPLYQAIALLGLVVIIIMGGDRVIKNVYLIGTLSSYITTYLLVAKKISKVGKVFNSYQAFKVSFNRTKEFLVIKPTAFKNIKLKNKTLVLKNFVAYNAKMSLPALNLRIDGPQLVGVCGMIHTGKSTLLKALSGFYPYEGEAKLGEVEVKDIKESINNYIGLAPTETALFSDTLANNIMLGNSGDLAMALKTSNLLEDLEQIGGLDTKIAHTNANISGGQSRRLGMARALFANPYLILLDDPFQSVSPDMARLMLENLKQFYLDHLIIFISNNKDLLAQAEHIIFLSGNNYYYDTYNNLLNNPSFCQLIEGVQNV